MVYKQRLKELGSQRRGCGEVLLWSSQCESVEKVCTATASYWYTPEGQWKWSQAATMDALTRYRDFCYVVNKQGTEKGCGIYFVGGDTWISVCYLSWQTLNHRSSLACCKVRISLDDHQTALLSLTVLYFWQFSIQRQKRTIVHHFPGFIS